MKLFVRVVLLIVIVVTVLNAYVPRRILTSVGVAFEKWADTSFPILWRLNPSRGPNITGSRSLDDLARLGFQAWSSVSTAQVSFSEGQATTIANAALDGFNVVAFAPTSYGSDAAALTVVYSFSQTGTDSFGRRIEFPGQILEADILFNPNVQWSTNPSTPADRIDLQSQMTHEIGHLLGLDHSGLVSAVMFPTIPAGTMHLRTLSADDVIGLSTLYPSSGFLISTGAVRGVMRTLSGGPVFGAHVVIVNESGRPVTSILTDSDGTYQVQGLDPGNYTAYAEPMDGPINPAAIPTIAITHPNQTPNSQFITRFAIPATTAALTLLKTAGDAQTGNIGQALGIPLEVQVQDTNATPVTGKTVTFAALSGGGNVVPTAATTDAQGKARTTAYLGTGPVQAFAASVESRSVTFNATLRPFTFAFSDAVVVKNDAAGSLGFGTGSISVFSDEVIVKTTVTGIFAFGTGQKTVFSDEVRVTVP